MLKLKQLLIFPVFCLAYRHTFCAFLPESGDNPRLLKYSAGKDHMTLQCTLYSSNLSRQTMTSYICRTKWKQIWKEKTRRAQTVKTGHWQHLTTKSQVWRRHSRKRKSQKTGLQKSKKLLAKTFFCDFFFLFRMEILDGMFFRLVIMSWIPNQNGWRFQNQVFRKFCICQPNLSVYCSKKFL